LEGISWLNHKINGGSTMVVKRIKKILNNPKVKEAVTDKVIPAIKKEINKKKNR
jgi:hypothetical protein